VSEAYEVQVIPYLTTSNFFTKLYCIILTRVTLKLLTIQTKQIKGYK
jgi:hypothetical protein